jgi:hypothetical protein
MVLGMPPLPWGYVLFLFKRLGFPDWQAHARMMEAPQVSLAEQRREKLREAGLNQRTMAPPVKGDDR